MNTTTLLNAMLRANQELSRKVAVRTDLIPWWTRRFRQSQKFERRLRKVLREYDELRSIKAQ